MNSCNCVAEGVSDSSYAVRVALLINVADLPLVMIAYSGPFRDLVDAEVLTLAKAQEEGVLYAEIVEL